MNTLAAMKERLKELKEKIQETEKRLPAHSVKPPIMMELLALEDEYETLISKIAALSRNDDASDRRKERQKPSQKK